MHASNAALGKSLHPFRLSQPTLFPAFHNLLHRSPVVLIVWPMLAERFCRVCRSASNIVMPSAYMWYLAQFQAGNHPYTPESRTVFSSVNDLLARRFVDAAGQDFANRLADNDEAARDYAEDNAGTSDIRSSVTPAVQKVAMGYEVRQGLIGPYSAQQARRELYRLLRAWSQPGAKVVCLNDDMSGTFAYARPIVDDLIRDFLGSRYPKESQFEVPHHRSNGCK